MISRQARRILELNAIDLWRNRQSLMIPLITLVVGFFALFLSLGLRESQQLLIQNKARELLSGDVQISSTREINPQELKAFSEVFKPTASSPEVSLQANLRSQNTALLVELKAVTKNFPLIGQMRLDNNNVGATQDFKSGEIWLADELREILNLKLGDHVLIGTGRFRIAHWIEADVGFRRGATGFAPRAYIPIEDLPHTGLIQPGSQIRYQNTFLMEPQSSTIEQLKTKLINWPDDLIVRSPDDAVSGIKRGIGYVESYLSLITLLLMLLGFISGFYLIQIHLRERALSLALGLLFGARAIWLEVGLILQVLVLIFTAWFLAALCTLGLFHLVNPSLASLLPGGAELVLGQKSFLVSLGLVLLNTVIFSLPFVFRFRRLEPEVLLNQLSPSLPMTRWREDFWPYSLSLIGYSGLAAWLQQSWIIAVLISLTLLCFATIAALGLPSWARTRQKRNRGLARLAWLGLARPRLLTALIWIALGWSATLGTLIPNLLAQARVELKAPQARELPQLFAINVRAEDVSPLQKAVQKEGAELRHISPLILARLRKINSAPVTEGSLARFPVRLTYREKLSGAEKIVEGSDLAPRFNGQGIPGLSVEVEFARRNNLKIGDHMEFEVAGIPLVAVIQNLREVKWNTFQPNFFMQLPLQVLEDYPQSYLAVIYGLAENQIFATQGRLSELFPSLSLLNLATTLDRLSGIAESLIWPITAISLAGLVSTLLLVGLLSAHLWQERLQERRLFFWLGANDQQIRELFLRENIWMTGSALFFGGFIGSLISIFVSRQIFDRWLLPQEFGTTLLLFLGSLILSTLPIWLTSSKRS